MLSDRELRELCQRLGLSQEARAIIDNVRSSQPSRPVQGGAGNVTVRYPSRKMGGTIQAESHRNEFPAVLEFEFDPDVLEYYDQPPPMTLHYPSLAGQPLTVPHTPDYFVIRIDTVGWVECKMENALIRLAERSPHRWVRDAQTGWHCPPGEDYAKQFGFAYWVRSSAQIDRILDRNFHFLGDYLRPETPQVDEAAAKAICLLVTQEPGIALDELLSRTGQDCTDEVYTLIAKGQLYVDWRAAPFAEPDRVHVYPDCDTARAYVVMATPPVTPVVYGPRHVELTVGSPIAWDGQAWTILNTGQTTITLLREDRICVDVPTDAFEKLLKQGKLTASPTYPASGTNTAAHDRLLKAHPRDLDEANRRYEIIAPYLAGHSPDSPTKPARTIRFWIAKWRTAEREYGRGYIGLIPRWGDRGNRTRKLEPDTLTAIHDFIANRYESLQQRRKQAVYAMLVADLTTRKIPPPSYKTFCHEVYCRPRQEQVEKRMGRRAAYPLQPVYWELTQTTPRHGDRPWEICHIDHTLLDIELVCSQTGHNLNRPWATFLTDAYSRRLLGVYLTYDPPSYRSNMMILRLCVQRHARLPETLVVDGGPEFRSTYFETLAAMFQITMKTRPPAEPRFGSIIERLFGTANTQLIHTLTGNTQITRNVRQVTKAVNPKNHACWTLGRLYECLCEWAYQVYDTTRHRTLGESPQEAYVTGVTRGGPREHIRIPYTDTFYILTLPSTRKGTAQADFRLGVKINNIHYYNEAFRDHEIERKQVPVRYDPFDLGVAFAFVKGRWVRCVSGHAFTGRSEKEVMLASAELRRRNQYSSEQYRLTSAQMGRFLTSTEAEEALQQQRLQDAERKDVLRIIQGGRASDVSVAELPPSSGSHPESVERSDEPKSSDTQPDLVYGDYI